MTSGVVKASDPADGPVHYTFVPDEPLLPDTDYLLHVAGVRDTDGLPLDAMTLSVRTASAPAVVRFRPAADTKNVDRAAPISVRFSKAMERRSTARAFTVSVGGKAIAGAVSWAEKDTVLVFTPASPLPVRRHGLGRRDGRRARPGGSGLAIAAARHLHDAGQARRSGTSQAQGAEHHQDDGGRRRRAGPRSRPTTSAS